MNEQTIEPLRVLVPVAVLAFLLALGLIVLLRPWLARYAMAQPNCPLVPPRADAAGRRHRGRGCHAARRLGRRRGVACRRAESGRPNSLAVSAAAALLAVVGAIDDMRSVAGNGAACRAVRCGRHRDRGTPGRIASRAAGAWWIERACLFLGGVWFVNLVNFMDGIDWMTVAEVVPVTGALVLLGLSGTIGLVA